MLKKITDYFSGMDIINCYNELKEKYPEKVKQLNYERNQYILFGKILPSIIDIGGIISLCTGETAAGASVLGIGEGMRNAINPNLLEVKLKYAYEGVNEAINEVIESLNKK